MVSNIRKPKHKEKKRKIRLHQNWTFCTPKDAMTDTHSIGKIFSNRVSDKTPV